jgi:3D (Asp-Asp-Asp) domain-containing protein
MFKIFFVAAIIVLSSVDSVAMAATKIIPDAFNFEEAPLLELGEPLLLWATNYHLPEFTDGTGDVPIRDIEGKILGPKLSLQDWCKSALEGSFRIISKDRPARVYNYDVSNELFPNDCTAFYPFNLGKTKFKLANGTYGDGVRNFILRPYRTLATDPAFIPTGSIVYIPEARGAIISISKDVTILHDGYFFAGDMGGAIKLNHIDVFIGSHDDSPFFPWITHSSATTFKAFIVKDQKIIDQLTTIHQR